MMQPPNIQEKRAALLELSHELGCQDRHQAILGEGNTSARLNAETFLVKASGTSLGTLKEHDLVACRANALLPLLEKNNVTDSEMEAALLAARVDSSSKKPSIEALFHAWLLSLPDIEFVGHTHALAVNQILCSPRAREFAQTRLFPDEIVYCGIASVFVPYTDPGLSLAHAIREKTEAFIKKYERRPRIILLENHGVIALGKTAEAVLASLLMEQKSAVIWLGAAALGGPKFLAAKHVRRIDNRPDEHYRQRALNL